MSWEGKRLGPKTGVPHTLPLCLPISFLFPPHCLSTSRLPSPLPIYSRPSRRMWAAIMKQCCNQFICIHVIPEISFAPQGNMDCTGDNLLEAYGTQHCNKICTANSNCGGYIHYLGVCYFKDATCMNNLWHHVHRTTYVRVIN